MPLPLMPFPGSAQKGLSLKQLITAAGLWANCELCLDPGDHQSWPGSGSTIFDVSGNGLHFTLGSAASPAAAAPSFAGKAGARSANEYLVNNGANNQCGLSLASGVNSAFLDSLHKSSFNWSIVELGLVVTNSVQFVTKTGAVTSSAVGVSNYISSSGFVLANAIGNGSGNVGSNSSGGVGTSTLQMLGTGRKWNSNSNRDASFYINGTYSSSNNTSSFTPSTSNASTRALIGLVTDASNGWPVGRRMYGFAMFDHMLVQAEYDALRTQFLKRWSGI